MSYIDMDLSISEIQNEPQKTKLDFWQEHIRFCEESSSTLKEHFSENGLAIQIFG